MPNSSSIPRQFHSTTFPVPVGVRHPLAATSQDDICSELPAVLTPLLAKTDGVLTGGPAITNTVARMSCYRNIYPKGGSDMGVRGMQPKLTDMVLEEAEDVDSAAAAVLRLLTDARKDGVITVAEADEILFAARRTLREAREVVQAAERATVADSLADNIKRGGITPHVAKRARSLGMNVVAFPAPDGPRAA